MNKIDKKRFRQIIIELIDDNPFAIRPVLKILEIVFTTSVPTLAVTCEERPRFLVNLEFIGKHCRNENHVKALICHEFLHVVLRHTETRRSFTAARHLAFDAVINSIIHRQYGEAYSSMMAEYYGGAKNIRKLLRPMNPKEKAWFENKISAELPQWAQAWAALYAGELVADDIEGLAGDIKKNIAGSPDFLKGLAGGPFSIEGGLPDELGDLLGGHENLGEPLPEALRKALEKALMQMNGSGIWRMPKGRGAGGNLYEALFAEQNEPMRRWQQKTLNILKRHLSPDKQSRAKRLEEANFHVPVLSPKDRRAFMRALWAPFLPDAEWNTQQPKREGTAQVYLDVSGSMYAEMPILTALLGRLSRYIRRPFWAFSTKVAPAVIEHGQLKARTTGGTSISCVLEHIAKTRPSSAVVVTDGYIEPVERSLINKISATRLHVIVTRDGSPAELERAGLPYTQLEELPL